MSSFWQRILNWHSRQEPAPFVPVYPELPSFCSGAEQVASPIPPKASPAVEQFRPHKPSGSTYRGTKPWNKPKAAQKIANGVITNMRDWGEIHLTIPEVDEWIDDYCHNNGLELGALSHRMIRAAMKRCSGVDFQNRRLITDPAYEDLRRRHKARRLFVPARAWIFIIKAGTEPVEASVQLNRRAA